MIQVKRIYPECCADTLLVELILKKGKPAHYKGITKVAKSLKSFSNDTLFVVGLLDTDKFKREPEYIEEFETIDDRINEESLLIGKHPSAKKYIIRVHPEFEPWIWQLAEHCGVDPKDYGFDTIEKLYEASKTEEIRENPSFKKFINAVVLRNPTPIETLRHWLNKVFEE